MSYLLEKLLFMFLISPPLGAVGVGIVLIMFPGTKITHSLEPAYFTPQNRIKTLSLIYLKIYSVFLGASHEAFSSGTFYCSLGHHFTIKNNHKNNLDYLSLSINLASIH